MTRDAQARADAFTAATADARGAVTYPELDRAMDRYAQGDDAAFAALHAGLEPRLRRFLLRLTGDPSRAADLAQEAFLRIHRSRGSFAAGGAVMPWALAIARNVYRDEVHRYQPPLERDDKDGEAAVTRVPAQTGTAEQHALAHEAADVVRRVLAALPVAQREAFVMLRFEGLSLKEIAEILDVTPTAVKLRAFRAYEAIRDALREREER